MDLRDEIQKVQVLYQILEETKKVSGFMDKINSLACKVLWVTKVEKMLLDVMDENTLEEFLIEYGFGKDKHHIDDLITCYQELLKLKKLEAPTISDICEDQI